MCLQIFLLLFPRQSYLSVGKNRGGILFRRRSDDRSAAIVPRRRSRKLLVGITRISSPKRHVSALAGHEPHRSRRGYIFRRSVSNGSTLSPSATASVARGCSIFPVSLAFEESGPRYVSNSREEQRGMVYLQNDGGHIRPKITCQNCVNLVTVQAKPFRPDFCPLGFSRATFFRVAWLTAPRTFYSLSGKPTKFNLSDFGSFF